MVWIVYFCCGVAVKLPDCSFEGSEFELQSRHKVHFRTNTLGKNIEHPHVPVSWLNSTTTSLLQRWP